MSPNATPTLGSLLTDTVLAERYRVDGILGEGGMAVVFEGHHLGLDRPIAIKVLKPEFMSTPQVLARFEQEARAVSRLEHAGIVRMFDVGTAEVPGAPGPLAFLVMERLHGAELSDVLAADGPPPIPTTLAWIETLLEAIAHAHSREIVHRDLKPENIFVCRTPEGSRSLKLVDFGIAKMVQPEGAAPLTQLGMVFGTPLYMSPEQATGLAVDARTDLYSVGIILYELLSGHVPFNSPEMMEILRMQVKDAPAPLPVPTEVSELLDRLLAKDPDDRFPHANAAIEAVKAAREALEAPRAPMAPTLPRVEPAAEPLTSPTAQDQPTTVPPASPPVVAEPVQDAGPSPRRVPPAVAIGAAAAGALVLVLAGWAVLREGDPAETNDSATTPAAVAAPAPAQAPVSPAPTVSPDALQAVDDALQAGERGQASTLVKTLLLAHPDNADVLWRVGLTTGDPARHSKERASYFLEAIRSDPERIKNGSVQAVLLKDLARKTVPDALIDLVVEHGEPIEAVWTKALLGRKKGALPPAQRARLIAATDPGETWSLEEQRCLDLWQALDTARPCTTYDETLDAMEAAPSADYLRTVKYAPVPTVAGDDDPAGACKGLEARRDAVAGALSGAKGNGRFVPADFVDQVPKQKSKRRKPLQRIFGG
jgi:hypothetical protein